MTDLTTQITAHTDASVLSVITACAIRVVGGMRRPASSTP